MFPTKDRVQQKDAQFNKRFRTSDKPKLRVFRFDLISENFLEPRNKRSVLALDNSILRFVFVNVLSYNYVMKFCCVACELLRESVET